MLGNDFTTINISTIANMTAGTAESSKQEIRSKYHRAIEKTAKESYGGSTVIRHAKDLAPKLSRTYKLVSFSAKYTI